MDAYSGWRIKVCLICEAKAMATFSQESRSYYRWGLTMMNVACLSNWLAVEEPKFTRKQRGASIVSEIDDGAWYVISVAAIKAEVHEQTLRHYERLGLISPARKGNSPHSPRLYSDRDIERVVQIRSLMQDLGVNLAGVETILHMRNLIEQMQLEMQDRVERVQAGMDQEIRRLQDEHEAETRRLKGIIERLQRERM